MILMNPKGKKSITALISENLYNLIKAAKQKAIIWRQLGMLFVAMGKFIKQKDLDKLKKEYPLAYQFIEELP